MSISHITSKLISPAPSPELDVLFSSLSSRDATKYLQELEHANKSKGEFAVYSQEPALNDAVLGRLVAAVYTEALDILLAEAIEAEAEADWWADLGRSRLTVAHYLVQTLPLRFASLFRDVLRILHSNNQSLSFSAFKPSSIRSLLSSDTGRPGSIIVRIFPHLHTTHPGLAPPPTLAPLGIYSRSRRSTSTSPSNIIASASQVLRHTFSLVTQYLVHLVTLPVQLANHEIQAKRLELERIRNERAEALGELTSKRDDLSRALREDLNERTAFLQVISQVLVGQDADMTQSGLDVSLLDALATTSFKVVPMHMSLHRENIHAQSLLRPSRFVRIWPRLLVLPPLILYTVQRVSASQDTLLSLANDAWETLKGFWRGWMVEPLTEIAKTVRTGGEGGIIVQEGSIGADLQSLERMALSLARDKLNYSPAQLDDLSIKLRHGDLTPILQIYEKDIKNPVRSAISGTLLRTVFVQVQKAKVDVDQALAGIDKLLKSQELTFAFVGVAPAFSLVYVVGGYFRGLFAGASRYGRLGGTRRRTAAWLAIRRIERLLITQPHTHDDNGGRKGTIPHLTAGLLLLSVSSLRQYAETWLPPRSRLREGFLEDVGDLEDPGLDREEKMRVVERMWRSWGRALGWDHLAAAVSS
ncbi:ATP synthase regulation protein NCA2-domain-containing protein [Lactarius quietus]|nr:ATP synthase regulation protein NCA2-domain-containing protein [Lactarius quietus]